MPSRDPETGRFISGQTDSHEEDTPQVAVSRAEVGLEAPIEEPMGDTPGDPVEDDYPEEEDYEEEAEMCTVCDSEEADDGL